MAKHRKEHAHRLLAIVASIALVVGLLPASALGADGEPAGQAPEAPAAAPAGEGAAQPGTSPVPEKGKVRSQDAGEAAPDAAAASKPEGGKAVTDDVGSGAPAQQGEAAGLGGAQAADNGADAAAAEGAVGPGAPSAEDAVEGEGPEPDEAAAEAVEEGKEGTGEGDVAGDAEGKPEADEGKDAEYPAFRQSQAVGGVTVTVEAEAGAFPEDAKLSVAGAPASATETAVAPERGAGENVAASYTFDIKVLDGDGGELQPANGKGVRVSFAAAEVADPNLDVSVYHVSAGEAEELAVSESGSTATAQSDGFSYYTVEFTYNNLQYVLQGDSEIPLVEILSAVGLVGEPTDAVSSNPDLFGVEKKDGAWTVSARRAFSSAEALTVTINGQNYEIAVTDEQVVDRGDCGDGVTWELTGQGDDLTLTISYAGGTGKMTDYEIYAQCPWYGHRLDIRAIAIGQGVTSIGRYAFYGFGTITSVEIPPGVTSIGAFAFGSCIKITSVVIPESVTSIGASAFSGCDSLTSFAIGQGVTSIEENTFDGCRSLESVTIPKSVTAIYYHAFSRCPKLRRLDYGGTFNEWSSIHKHEKWASGTPSDMVVVCGFDGTVGHSPDGGGEASARVEVSHNETQPLATAIATATPNEGYVFENWTEDGEVVSEEATYSFSPGKHTSLTANFKIPLTITARDQTLAYSGQTQGEGDTVYEDPAEIAEKFEVEGLRPGDTLKSVTLDGQGKDAGGYELVPGDAAIGGDNAGDYAITYVPGTLTIEPAAATVATGSATKAYDGEALTNSEASITGLVGGETATVTATGSQTEVGSSPNTYSIDWGSTDAKNYTVTEKLGTLTVEAVPARPVYQVTSGGGSTYVGGSGEPMVFRVERSVDPGTAFGHFAGIEVDGKAVPQKGASGEANWTARSGSVIVELQPSYLETLPAGTHTMAALFDDGDPAVAEFEVSAAPVPATHTVTFDANGHGRAPAAQEVEDGKAAKKPADPKASGWTFGGWYTDEKCTRAYDFSKPVTSDITLYAKWTKKSSSGATGSGASHRSTARTADPIPPAVPAALALAAVAALALARFALRRFGDGS